MKLKSAVFSFLIVLLCSHMNAQATSITGNNALSTLSESDLNFINQTVTSTKYEKIKTSYEKINGSPYLIDRPVNGTIIKNNGDEINNVPLLIDNYRHMVIATNENGEDVVLDGRFYDQVIILFEGNKFVYKKANPKKPTQFYEVMYENDRMIFFKENNIQFKEGSTIGVTNIESQFRSSKPFYYISFSDGEVKSVKLKKKDILSLFPNSDSKAMEAYAKENGIKLKKEADYVEVFNSIYSSLSK